MLHLFPAYGISVILLQTSTMKRLLIFSLLILSIGACKKDKETQADKDDKIIQQYLSDNDLEATKHASGLYYNITKEGSGYNPTVGYTVRVIYKGWLTNGTVFDEVTTPLDISLSSVITGWKIGVPMLKPGGKGTFYIPSELAYGENAVGSIPANSVLIFNIELVDFY
ncbi:MAG: FKBP-type peptidyl-prolyl cis-trans isomerase [Bacteroidales bacterium]